MARRRGTQARVDAAIARNAGKTAQFSGDLAAFARRTKTTMDEAHRGVVIELFSRVINTTPVDEGRAAGNWRTNVGSPAVGVIDRISTDGAVVISEVVANAGKAGDKVYMANSLPYIERLEFGWSKQAPSGMVRMAYAEVQQIVNAVVAKVRK